MDPLTARVSELIRGAGRGTPRKLAQHLGVGEPTVSRWANGLNPPSREYWPGIEEYFSLDAGSLGIEGLKMADRLAALEADVRSLKRALSRIERLLPSGEGEPS